MAPTAWRSWRISSIHTNVGALMRSAAALDVDAVLVTPSCGDPLYRRAARVSMGTVFQVPWTRIGGDDKHYWPFTGHAGTPSIWGSPQWRWRLRMIPFLWPNWSRRLNNTETESAAYRQTSAYLRYRGRWTDHHTIARADLTVKIPMTPRRGQSQRRRVKRRRLLCNASGGHCVRRA